MARLTAQVPKDLNTIEPKFILGFTKRQLIWNCIGAVVGILTYFTFKDLLSTAFCMVVTMAFAFPFVLVSIFQKEGLTVEEIIKHFFISQYRQNPIRIYKKSQQLSDLLIEAQEEYKTSANTKRRKKNGKRKK